LSADKDSNAETAASGVNRAAKTAVGVPALPDVPADRPSDLRVTRPLLPKEGAETDEASTELDVPPVSAEKAERVLEAPGLASAESRAPHAETAPASPERATRRDGVAMSVASPPKGPGVAGALPKPAPKGQPSTKTLPPSADMFHARGRTPSRAPELEKGTRPGLAPDAPPSRGRSTLLLDSSAQASGPRDLDPSKERPPIVLPGSRAIPPKAITQAPPWSEGAARVGSRIPKGPSAPRSREPSIEEISSSLLLADASGELPETGVEELSGSLLIEEAPDGRPALKPVPTAPPPARPSVKPPVPKSRSTRPSEAAHRALLGVPEVLQATPAADLASSPTLVLTVASPPSSPTLDSTAAPSPTLPSRSLDVSAVASTSAPPGQTAPAAEAAAPPVETRAPEPVAPMSGDIEVTRLPRSGIAPLVEAVRGAMHTVRERVGRPAEKLLRDVIVRGKALRTRRAAGAATGEAAQRSATTFRPRALAAHAGLRDALQNLRARLRAEGGLRGVLQVVRTRLLADGALGAAGRPKWFLPVVAGAGLIVGIGFFAILASLIRGAGSAQAHDESPRVPSASTPALLPPALGTSVTSPPLAETPTAVPPPPAPPAWSACTVSGIPHVIAPTATLAAGVEVVRVGDDLALGFAPSDHEAIGVRLDAASLAAKATAKVRSRGAVRRVTPLPIGRGALILAVDTDDKNDRLQGRRTVVTDPAVQLGAADGHIAWARLGGAPSGALWALDEGADVESLRGAAETAGEPTLAVAFRRGGAIWMGVSTGSQPFTPKGSLGRIDGLGTAVGSPAVALSGGGALVAWSDRSSSDDPWRLRWTRFDAGSAPSTPETFVPPAGGKGEQAMSPSLTALPGGRFLFVWTEGPASGHDVRALTLGPDGKAVGAPLVISTPGVNAGQGQAAVTSRGPGVVAFLESGGNGYQVVATPIACGP
jgi:hypothetical protein